MSAGTAHAELLFRSAALRREYRECRESGGSAATVTWAELLLAACEHPEDMPGADSEEMRLGGPWEDDP